MRQFGESARVRRAWTFGWRAVLPTLLTLLTPALAAAQGDAWPARPVKIIVPFGPGGANDITGRLLANELSMRLNQSVVVDNRNGAGGAIGTDAVAKSRPDGYTLGMGNGSALVLTGLGRKLPYGTQDFTYVGPIARVEMVMVARKDFAPNRLSEVLALAKARPGALTYAGAGADRTGIVFLTFEYMSRNRGLEFLAVPYNGDAPIMNALNAGEVDLGIITVASSGPQIKAGKIKAIAIGGGERSSALPEVPTLRESGMQGLEAEAWSVLIGPAGMPADITRKLNVTLNEILRTPAVRERFATLGLAPRTGSSQDAADMVARELKRWTCVDAVVNGKGNPNESCF